MLRGWTAEEKLKNAQAIIAQNIDGDPLGRQLTRDARARAIDFAVSVWKGNMGNGDAARMGIKHVTADIIKPR